MTVNIKKRLRLTFAVRRKRNDLRKGITDFQIKKMVHQFPGSPVLCPEKDQNFHFFPISGICRTGQCHRPVKDKICLQLRCRITCPQSKKLYATDQKSAQHQRLTRKMNHLFLPPLLFRKSFSRLFKTAGKLQQPGFGKSRSHKLHAHRHVAFRIFSGRHTYAARTGKIQGNGKNVREIFICRTR